MFRGSSLETAWRRVLAATILCLAITVPAVADQPRAKYVFLFIGDGMGLAQRTAGELYQAALLGEEATAWRTRLAMNRLSVAGMTTTYSRNQVITDSAAAGTALACGLKTDNGALGMVDGRPVGTIAEVAQRSGMRVGIITSVSIDHATPACFYAHQPSRSNYYDIAMELPASGFDYFAGAKLIGEKPDGDGPVPYDVAREAGYTLVTSHEQFRALASGARKVWVAVEDFPYEMDRQDDAPSLADYTRKGIELLEGDEGFFMMIEGGRIDWACHANDAAATVTDVLALDRAVAEAMAFAARHPEETLIVVTADHETGGMTLGSVGAAAKVTAAALAGQKHFGSSFGETVKQLRESKADFDAVVCAVEEAFGLDGLTDVEREKLQAAWQLSLADLPSRGRDENTYRLYSGRDPLTAACVHMVGLRAGIGWTTWSHTASPVPVTAGGAGSERFAGCYDNTDIPRRLAAAMGLSEQFDAAKTPQPAPAAAPAMPAGGVTR